MIRALVHAIQYERAVVVTPFDDAEAPLVPAACLMRQRGPFPA